MVVSKKRLNEIISNCINDEVRRVMEESIAHANCYGVPRGLLEYRKSEREGILIVEKRSVAAYIYRNEIKEIAEYINNLLSSGNINNHYYVLENCGFAQKCVLLIYFIKENEEEAIYLDELTVFKEGVVERVCFRIFVNPYNHNELLMSQFLYHELNYCEDDIKRILNGRPSLHYEIFRDDPEINYEQVCRNMRNDYAAYLVYYIFTDTELNVYGSQFYSELQDSNTTREQFDSFFRNSRAYKIYDSFIFAINSLEKQTGWETKAMQYFNRQFKSVQSFRMWFLGIAKHKASKFYNQLCKVASLYYETI